MDVEPSSNTECGLGDEWKPPCTDSSVYYHLNLPKLDCMADEVLKQVIAYIVDDFNALMALRVNRRLRRMCEDEMEDHALQNLPCSWSLTVPGSNGLLHFARLSRGWTGKYSNREQLVEASGKFDQDLIGINEIQDANETLEKTGEVVWNDFDDDPYNFDSHVKVEYKRLSVEGTRKMLLTELFQKEDDTLPNDVIDHQVSLSLLKQHFVALLMKSSPNAFQLGSVTSELFFDSTRSSAKREWSIFFSTRQNQKFEIVVWNRYL